MQNQTPNGLLIYSCLLVTLLVFFLAVLAVPVYAYDLTSPKQPFRKTKTVVIVPYYIRRPGAPLDRKIPLLSYVCLSLERLSTYLQDEASQCHTQAGPQVAVILLSSLGKI